MKDYQTKTFPLNISTCTKSNITIINNHTKINVDKIK